MTAYSRWSPPDGLLKTVQHVAAHLSSVVSDDDSPTRYAWEVRFRHEEQDNGVLITGVIDRDPVADYLRPEFDPEADVAANPLSVPSIEVKP